MSQSTELYQAVILDHNRKPRNWGILLEPTHTAEGINPLCGDRINLMLKVVNETIHEIAFEGEGCAICKASASMMRISVKGKTVDGAQSLVTEFRKMVVSEGDIAGLENLGRLKIFEGIRGLPSRVKCAVLPWHTLHAAFTDEGQISTEGDDDPIG